jgi:hypothetical protein
MQRILRAAACGMALFSISPVFAVTLNFDDLGSGTTVTNQYGGNGIVFAAAPGFTILDHTFGGVVFTPSGSNYLAVTGNGTVNFMIGAAPGAVDFFSFSTLGLISSGGFYNGAIIDAYDTNGNLITSTTVNPVGPSEPQSYSVVNLIGPGIHEVRFTHISNSSGEGPFGLDDLTFDEVIAVPEPGSMILLSAGLLAFGLATRRRKNTSA